MASKEEIDLYCCHMEIGSEGISIGSVALLQRYTSIMSISFLLTFRNPSVLVSLLSLKVVYFRASLFLLSTCFFLVFTLPIILL